MAYSSRTYTPGSSTTTFALTTSDGDPIGYIRESDIEVKVNASVQAANTYSFSGTKTVEQPSGGNIVLNSGVTGTVILSRTTAIQNATVVYTAGSTLTSTDLNNADNQIRFGLQEFSDDYASLLGTGGNLTDLASFIGGSDSWVSNDAKAATTAAIDGQIDAKATAKVKDDIIATAPVSIADDTPSSGKITISVDAELTELATMSTGTAQALADLTGTEVQILDGATLTTTELNYVDGVTSAVQTQLDGKQPLDAELTELATMGSTTAEALADLTQAEVQILDGATATTAELNILDGVTSTTAELNILDGVTSTAAELNILDGVTATTAEINYVDGVTSNVQTQVDAKQPLDADLTTLAGMHSTTASTLSANTALNSTIAELNQLDGITLAETALTTNSNTAVPTSKAVADHVAGAVTAVGGFKAIANDASFPATASQPANGVVVSINDAQDVAINGSGVSTTGRTTDGTPATVTINGFPASLYNETLRAGVGLQVTSTGSSNIYNYHKVLATESDVKQLSDDINDFNERYRTDATGNNPSSDNHAGDLFYNQGSDKMYVRNGANNAWEEVTSIGDFKFLFLCPKNGGSGNPTFDSNEKEFDLRETSNTGTGASVTNAAQLTISVNGVVQKPNAGTNESGLDGFVLADSNTIKFCAAPANGDEIFVIQSGSAVTLNAPANNTVGTDQLMSQAVTEPKLLISNAPSDGKFLQYKDSSDKLTWADVPAGVGGANGVAFNDNVTATWGTTTTDLQIKSDGSNGQITVSDELEFNAGSTNDALKITQTGVITNTDQFVAYSDVVVGSINSGERHYLGIAEDAANGTNTIRFYAPASLANNLTYYLELAGGSNGQALVLNNANIEWGDVSSTSADGTMYKNTLTISNDTTIAATEGAHSVGPITNNATVTVNGRWVIS